MSTEADQLARRLALTALAGFVVATALLASFEHRRLVTARETALAERAQLVSTRLDALIDQTAAIAARAASAHDAMITAEARRRLVQELGQTPLTSVIAYTREGALIFDIGAPRTTAVRLQSFAGGDAEGSHARLLALEQSGGILYVNLAGAGGERASAALPATVVEAWLAPSPALPHPLVLRIHGPEADGPWLTLGAGNGAPAGTLLAAAPSADRPFVVELATARPGLSDAIVSALPLWALMAGPALALMGAVIVRRRLAWAALERQRRSTAQTAALQAHALAQAAIGTVVLNVGDASVHFSETWRNLLGFSGPELADEINEWLDRIHPEDKGRCTRTYQELLDGATRSFEHELRLLHRDGRYRTYLERGERLPEHGAILVTLAKRSRARSGNADPLDYAPRARQTG